MRPLRWKRVFCSFVFSCFFFLTQRFLAVKEMHMCFVSYEYLGTAEKKTSELFLSISLEWLNNALFGKEIAVVLGLGLFRNALSSPRHVEYLSVRSLESWNRCTCISCTWLPFPIGQVCSQAWCRLYLRRTSASFPLSPSKVEVSTFYPFTL